jgi:tRNA1(Val) A37 N6-methylase TrmN6
MAFGKWAKEGETIDDLQIGGLKIIQRVQGFRFGIDSVLLSHFVCLGKNDKVLDLGTGTGIIPLLLSPRINEGHISALEILPDMAETASRSVRMNGLEDRVDVLCGDLKECISYYKPGTFDVVVTNPPYMNVGGGIVNPGDSKAIARHEIKCTLEDVVRAAALMLKHLGRFYMVHKPERMADIICVMRDYRLEPKKLRFVHSGEGKKASMVLVNGLKGGNPQVDILPPLYIYRDGEYSEEIRGIYGYSEKKEV